jgi:hypothetical protein
MLQNNLKIANSLLELTCGILTVKPRDGTERLAANSVSRVRERR